MITPLYRVESADGDWSVEATIIPGTNVWRVHIDVNGRRITDTAYESLRRALLGAYTGAVRAEMIPVGGRVYDACLRIADQHYEAGK